LTDLTVLRARRRTSTRPAERHNDEIGLTDRDRQERDPAA
jgi:hypothetical protein